MLAALVAGVPMNILVKLKYSCLIGILAQPLQCLFELPQVPLAQSKDLIVKLPLQAPQLHTAPSQASFDALSKLQQVHYLPYISKEPCEMANA